MSPRKKVSQIWVPLSVILLLVVPMDSGAWILKDAGPIGWKLLERVQYHYAWSHQWEMEVPVPSFPPALVAYSGKEYTLSGYYIPVELEEKEIFLSKEPFASCFFCGGAGPETVAEVHFANGVPEIQLDKLVTVQGTLRLNSDDYAHLFFILEDATLVENHYH